MRFRYVLSYTGRLGYDMAMPQSMRLSPTPFRARSLARSTGEDPPRFHVTFVSLVTFGRTHAGARAVQPLG